MCGGRHDGAQFVDLLHPRRRSNSRVRSLLQVDSFAKGTVGPAAGGLVPGGSSGRWVSPHRSPYAPVSGRRTVIAPRSNIISRLKSSVTR